MPYATVITHTGQTTLRDSQCSSQEFSCSGEPAPVAFIEPCCAPCMEQVGGCLVASGAFTELVVYSHGIVSRDSKTIVQKMHVPVLNIKTVRRLPPF
jgi:hypothetical protein